MDKIKGFMDTVISIEKILKVGPISMNWRDNSAVRALLDAVVGVMAEEYVKVARKNEGVFRDPGYFASQNSGMTKRGWK